MRHTAPTTHTQHSVQAYGRRRNHSITLKAMILLAKTLKTLDCCGASKEYRLFVLNDLLSESIEAQIRKGLDKYRTPTEKWLFVIISSATVSASWPRGAIASKLLSSTILHVIVNMDYSSTENEVKPPKFGILCPINTNTFPGKLWKLVNDGNCNSVTWNSSGSGIFINPTLFKEEVLHCEEFSMFKTQNFSSFVRQLNLYGFRKMTLSSKVKQGPCISKELLMHQFQHQCFIRSRPDLLHHVRRAGSRRKHRDVGFCGDSENISPALLKRSDGVSILTHPFHGWGLPNKRLSGYSMYSQPYPLAEVSDEVNSYSPSSCPEFPYQMTSPLHDVIKPLPTVTLQAEQHPYFRADSGQPCALSLTWMANTAKGSLTSGDFGTCPENLVENGRFRRFVLIPEESDSLSPGLKLPGPSYLEKFKPKVCPGTPTKSPKVGYLTSASHPISEEIFPSARETGTTTVARLNDEQTTVSWSTTSPKVTTEQTRSLYSNKFENASRECQWRVARPRQVVDGSGDADSDNRNYILRETLIDGSTGEIVVVAE